MWRFGTGDAGITSANWNVIPTSTGTASPGGFQTFTGNSFTGSLSIAATSATLTGNWLGVSGSYPVLFSNGDNRTVTFTNGSTSVSWTGGLSGSATATFLMYTLVLNSYTTFPTFYKGDPVTFTIVSGSLPGGLSAGTTYYLYSNVDYTTGSGIIQVAATKGGPYISYTSIGTGSYTITDLSQTGSSSILPIKNQSVSMNYSTPTSLTLSTAWAIPYGNIQYSRFCRGQYSRSFHLCFYYSNIVGANTYRPSTGTKYRSDT